MADDLLSALTGANANYSDPGTLAAPRLKLAQAMMQSGMDASPVGHWTQGLARIAQAGVGGVTQNAVTSDLAKSYAGTAEGLASSLAKVAPNHPLVAALRSPDPNVRMMAIKSGVAGLTSLPQQQLEHQRWQATFNKPDFGPVKQDEYGGVQYGFREPTKKTVTPYGAQQQTEPPPAAIEFLRQNPTTAAEFDRKYGIPGLASRFLGARP